MSLKNNGIGTQKATGAFYKSFFSMTLVIALQNLLVFCVNLADNVMIGKYNELSLSGVSLVNQIQFLLQMIAMGLTNGLVVMASQYWGKRNVTPIKRIFSAVLPIGIAVSIVFFIAALMQPQGLLALLTDDTAVIDEGALYFEVVCFSYPFFVCSFIITGLLRSVETVKIGFYVSLVALFVNVGLNYCLIFGKLGFPELGVRGAAIATVTARIVEFIIVCAYLAFADKKLGFKLRELFKWEGVYIKDYLRSGLPLCLSSTSWGLAMFLQTAIIGRLGQSAIAASSIATAIHQVASVVAYGTGSASSVIIGKEVGANRYDTAKLYAKKLQLLYLGVGAASAVLLFVLAKPIVAMYDVSEQTEELSLEFIYILCFALMGTAYQMPCLTGIVSGGGSTRFVLFNDIIFMWCMVLPMSYLSAFVFKWSIPLTFFILKSDQITKCTVAIVKVNRYKWIKQLTRDDAGDSVKASST